MKISSESEFALNALKRAAKEARRKAAEKNLLIPVWKDGAIVYENPKEISQPGDAPNDHPQRGQP